VDDRRERLREDEERPGRDDRPLEHGKIARRVRLEDERAQARALEEALEHHRAAEQRAELRRDDGHERARHHRQRVQKPDARRGRPLRPRDGQELRVRDLGERGAAGATDLRGER